MKHYETDNHDATLVALAKIGSASAIDQLVCKYWPVAYRAASAMLRCHADAEEIAQDTLWSAIRHLPSFRGDASFRTWLHRIAINHTVMMLRRRRKRTQPLSVTSGVYAAHWYRVSPKWIPVYPDSQPCPIFAAGSQQQALSLSGYIPLQSDSSS